MMSLIICVLVGVWYIVIWALGLIGWKEARTRYRIRPRSPLCSSTAEDVPGVSVLRPLKGLDTNLFENLESCFLQDYPKFEVIFAVADEDDQALRVVRELITKYPTINAEVVIGEEVVGVNPKINNLIRAYRLARHDILWVIDSNVQIAPGTMGRAVDALTHKPPASKPSTRRVGLVHHVPFALVSERSFGSLLEEAFLNTNHAKMYIALNILAIDSCATGKSNMYRKSDMERLTGSRRPSPIDGHGSLQPVKGLAAFGRFLAEDNMIGGALWHELGLRHDLSCDVAANAVGNMSFSTYFWRRVRWVRVRKHMVTLATVIEPFTESVVVGLLAGWAVRRTFGLPIWLFFLPHIVTWLAVDLDVYASLAGHPVPSSNRVSFLGAWACRELFALPIWFYAVLGEDVSWRGVKYRVLRNGEVRRVEGGGGWFSSLFANEPLLV